MDKPVVDLKTPYTVPPPLLNVPFVDLAVNLPAVAPLPILTLATRVTDGINTSTLGSLIRAVTDDHKIAVATDVVFSNGADEKPFDFKYDEATSKFGAGTAFLQD